MKKTTSLITFTVFSMVLALFVGLSKEGGRNTKQMAESHLKNRQLKKDLSTRNIECVNDPLPYQRPSDLLGVRRLPECDQTTKEKENG